MEAKLSITLCNTQTSTDVQLNPAGYSLEFLVGACCSVFQILTLFQTKNCCFPHLISDLAEAEIMSSLLRLERKQKNSSKIFRIRIFLCLSNSFGTEMINMFIHSHRSLESHTQFQTKMGKVYTRFQTSYSVGPKPILFRVAHTYIVDIKEYSPHPPEVKTY